MESWHGTTILGVKKGGRTVIAGDGQVSLGNTVIKPNAKKVRRLGEDGKVIAGFAGVMVPLTMERAGADPAVASSIFVTMVTDSMGFLVFLGLASASGLVG